MQFLPIVLSLLLILLPREAPSVDIDRTVTHAGWTTRHWTVEDGLPVNSVNAMVRDAQGFLWLATMDGLVRFDGVQFEVFDTLNSPGLAGNRLMVLARDWGNALWMTTEDMRLVHYDRRRFRTLGVDDGLPHEQVIALSVADRAVWVGTRRGAARWTGERFESVPEALWTERTAAVAQSGDGAVWLGSETGRVLRLAPDGSSRESSVPDRVWQIVPDGEGGVWIAHGSGLARWRPDGQAVADARVDFGVQRLERAGEGLYLSGSGQLFRLERRGLVSVAAHVRGSGRERLARVDPTGSWTNVEAGLLRDGQLVLAPRFPVVDWLVDDGGGLLVATAGDGLYRLAPSAFQRPAGPAALLDTPAYPVVSAPDGGVWIGTVGKGVYRVAPGETRATRIAPESAPEVAYTLLAKGDDNGWIGGYGLWRLEQGRAHQQGIPVALRTAAVRALFLDSRGRIWAGTEHDGLWRLDEESWQRMRPPAAMASASVRVIAESGEYIWFGTNGHGLRRFHESRGFEAFLEARPGRLIRALHFDDHERLLIGTEDRGLCRLDRPGARSLRPAGVRCLDRRDGLPHDGVHQILPDASGELWMSTNRGIFFVSGQHLDAAFDGGELAAVMLTEADGLPDREANGGVQSAGAVDAGGRLWFPTVRGPVALDTSRLPAPPPPPAAVIEQLITPRGAFALESARTELPVGVRNLTLRYTAPDFVSGAELVFETRLVGLDNRWQLVGARREVDFTNLPRGGYRFEVRARTESGRAGAVAGLELDVPPYFHETPVFRTGAVLFLLAVAWLGWRWRERRLALDRARLEHLVDVRTHELSEATAEAERGRDRIARQAQRLERLDEEKRGFFANISHELRTPLTLLLGPLEQGQRNPDAVIEQLPMLNRNARRLNRLVEQILDLQRIEGGQLKVEPELHDLAAWTRSITALFLPLARSNRISIELSEPPPGVLAWFDAGQMEKVLGNLLSNAIKYCRPGDLVTVSTAREGEVALVRVQDTGPGIAPEHLGRLFDRFYRAAPSDSPIEGTGIGLALARDLMVLHGGELTVDSAPGEGARFCLRWPARATEGRLSVLADEGSAAHMSSSIAGGPSSPPVPASEDAACILVVDDNADLRQWLRHVLGDHYRVDEASDGESALQRMAVRLPDLVVSDWMMPGMNGLELVQKMREDGRFQGVPVIVLSARAEVSDHVQGLDAGAVAYVRKPFRADVLKAQIESLLALRLRLRRELAAQPVPPIRAQGESVWMRRAREAIAAGLHDPEFGVEALAAALAIGRTGLFRKLKEECGQSPSALLREARLLRATELLDERAGTVSEVAYAVGFNSVEGFTRAFATRFGERPSERLAQAQSSSAPAQ